MKRKAFAIVVIFAVILAVSLSSRQSQAEGDKQAGELSKGQVTQRLGKLEGRVTTLEQQVGQLRTKVQALERRRGGGGVRPGSRAAWKKLELGMAPPKVRELLGEPLKVETTKPGQTTWRYDHMGAVHFRDRKVTSLYQPRWPKESKN